MSLLVHSYECFADRDPLTRAVMDRMLAGVWTRKFAVDLAADGLAADRALGHVHPGTRTLWPISWRRLDDVRLAVMMLDGLEMPERTHVVALGIAPTG